MFYIDKYYDPSDYLQPVKYYYKPFSVAVSNLMFTGVIFDIKQVNFIDDTGVILENKNVKSDLKVSQARISIDFRESAHFLEILFMYNQEISNISRRYKRLQEVVAEVGGLFSFLFTLAKLVVEFFSRRAYLNQLEEEYFNKKAKEPKKLGNSKEKK